MPEIKITAVSDGQTWGVLSQGADAEQFQPETIHTYRFSNDIKRTGLTKLRSRDRIQEFELTPDVQGRYNSEAYGFARCVADLSVHSTKFVYENDGKTVETILSDKGLNWISNEIPEEVLQAYFRQANPPMDGAKVLRPKPEETNNSDGSADSPTG